MTPHIDPHVLGPGLLPTPFSAAEIRSGTREGRTTRSLVQPAGQPAYVRVNRFAVCRDEGALMQRWQENDAGERVGAMTEAEVMWLDLQRHAAFPETSTTMSDETIVTGLGELECLVYRVTDGEEVTTFWFDLNRPGMPVRIVSEERGTLTEAVELVDDDIT